MFSAGGTSKQKWEGVVLVFQLSVSCCFLSARLLPEVG